MNRSKAKLTTKKGFPAATVAAIHALIPINTPADIKEVIIGITVQLVKFEQKKRVETDGGGYNLMAEAFKVSTVKFMPYAKNLFSIIDGYVPGVKSYTYELTEAARAAFMHLPVSDSDKVNIYNGLKLREKITPQIAPYNSEDQRVFDSAAVEYIDFLSNAEVEFNGSAATIFTATIQAMAKLGDEVAKAIELNTVQNYTQFKANSKKIPYKGIEIWQCRHSGNFTNTGRIAEEWGMMCTASSFTAACYHDTAGKMASIKNVDLESAYPTFVANVLLPEVGYEATGLKDWAANKSGTMGAPGFKPRDYWQSKIGCKSLKTCILRWLHKADVKSPAKIASQLKDGECFDSAFTTLVEECGSVEAALVKYKEIYAFIDKYGIKKDIVNLNKIIKDIISAKIRIKGIFVKRFKTEVKITNSGGFCQTYVYDNGKVSSQAFKSIKAHIFQGYEAQWHMAMAREIAKDSSLKYQQNMHDGFIFTGNFNRIKAIHAKVCQELFGDAGANIKLSKKDLTPKAHHQELYQVFLTVYGKFKESLKTVNYDELVQMIASHLSNKYYVERPADVPYTVPGRFNLSRAIARIEKDGEAFIIPKRYHGFDGIWQRDGRLYNFHREVTSEFIYNQAWHKRRVEQMDKDFARKRYL